jgi:hypothetical protein
MNEQIEKLSMEANAQTGNKFDLNHKPLDAFLEKFAELIVQECCNWIDGSPSTDAGQLVLTKSFIIDNLKNISELNNERTN